MALTAADLELARRIAASAPPLTAELREQLRAMLAGCLSAQVPAAPKADQGDTADAA